MKKTILAVIAIPLCLAVFAWAAENQFSNLRLTGEASGYRTNAFTNLALVDISGSSKLYPTNLFIGTNDTLGNTLTGNGAVLVHRNTSSGTVSNHVSGNGSVVTVFSSGTQSATNNVTGNANTLIDFSESAGSTITAVTGDGNLLVSHKRNHSGINEVSGKASINAFKHDSGTRGSGSGVRNRNSSNGSLAVGVASSSSATNNIGGFANIVAALAGSGSLNELTVNGGMLFTVADSSATNTATVASTIASLRAVGGGALNDFAAQGGIHSATADLGTNRTTSIAGSISALHTSGAGSLNVVSGSDTFTVAFSSGANSAVNAANGGILLTYANTTSAALGSAATGAYLWGGGYTNSFPKTAMLGYVAPWLWVSTNGYSSLVHIEGADDTVDWNMATNAYMGVVTLPAGSQSVFITNAIVTANSAVNATINTDDTTAITVKAIPAAGLLQLKAVAAATANTKITWHVLSP